MDKLHFACPTTCGHPANWQVFTKPANLNQSISCGIKQSDTTSTRTVSAQ